MVDTWTIIAGAGIGAVFLLGRNKKGPSDLTQKESNEILASTPEGAVADIADQEVQNAAPDEIFLPEAPPVPTDVSLPAPPPSPVLTPDSVACIKLSPPDILKSPDYDAALKATQRAVDLMNQWQNKVIDKVVGYINQKALHPLAAGVAIPSFATRGYGGKVQIMGEGAGERASNYTAMFPAGFVLATMYRPGSGRMFYGTPPGFMPGSGMPIIGAISGGVSRNRPDRPRIYYNVSRFMTEYPKEFAELYNMAREEGDLIRLKQNADSNFANVRHTAKKTSEKKFGDLLVSYHERGWSLHQVSIETKLPSFPIHPFTASWMPVMGGSAPIGGGRKLQAQAAPIDEARLMQAKLEATAAENRRTGEITIAQSAIDAMGNTKAIAKQYTETIAPQEWISKPSGYRMQTTKVVYVCPPGALISSLPTGTVKAIPWDEMLRELGRKYR